MPGDSGRRGIDPLVWLGIAVSSGLVVVSALVSARMSYRMADTELDGWLYAVGAALVDVLKAIVPFMVAWAFRRRDWLAVAGGAAVFVGATAFSFTNGLGFAADLRAFKEGGRTVAIETRADARREMARLEAERKQRAAARSVGEVEQAIREVLARPVGERSTVDSVSDGCIKARTLAREGCAEVGRLRLELAMAAERATIEAKLRELAGKLEGLPPESGLRNAEPQVEALRNVGVMLRQSWDADQVRHGLAVVVGLVFELASGLGLYVVMAPWRDRDMGRATPQIAERATETASPDGDARENTDRADGVTEIVEGAVRTGSVDAFAEECLVPRDGARLSSSALFQAYRAWCVARTEVPYREAEFVVMMQDLASEVGIPVSQRGGNVGFLDVALVTGGGASGGAA